MGRYSLYFKIMPQQEQILGESPAKDFFRVTTFVSLSLPSLGILFVFLSVCVSLSVGCLLVYVSICLFFVYCVCVSLFMCLSLSVCFLSVKFCFHTSFIIADNSDQVE